LSQKPSISKAFAKIVTDTETAIIADTTLNWGSLPKKVHFMSGNLLEISNRLTEMTNSPNPLISNGKYPLVALFKDITEDIIQGDKGLESTFDAKLGIFTLSTQTDRHDQRRDKNFIPILIPILEKMIDVISRSTQFGMPDIKSMRLKATNCYFYGSTLNNKNQFNDFVDAIEIERISLNIKNIIC
jgi:hypothetical protein